MFPLLSLLLELCHCLPFNVGTVTTNTNVKRSILLNILSSGYWHIIHYTKKILYTLYQENTLFVIFFLTSEKVRLKDKLK